MLCRDESLMAPANRMTTTHLASHAPAARRPPQRRLYVLCKLFAYLLAFVVTRPVMEMRRRRQIISPGWPACDFFSIRTPAHGHITTTKPSPMTALLHVMSKVLQFLWTSLQWQCATNPRPVYTTVGKFDGMLLAGSCRLVSSVYSCVAIFETCLGMNGA